jgi:N-acylglucosamine 2-epimerase
LDEKYLKVKKCMRKERVDELREFYRRYLLEDVVPFWLRYSLDQKYGGYFNFLDRDGSVYGTDKAMWLQCRAVWLFSKLYNKLEQREEWLDAAKLGFDFIMKHGFDTDGRMFFSVTRDGRPLRKRRYLFTESFGVMACAEYAKAAHDGESLQRAKDTYQLIIDLYRTPGSLPPKIFSQTRIMKSLAMPMILICITQELREMDSNSLYNEVIDDALSQILNHHLKRDKKVLLETVGPNGEWLDLPEGRCIDPGHEIEVAWFVMHEGLYRKDKSLVDAALEILDWSLEWGWDKKYGGILYFVDVEGKPPINLEWDMKLWWPHTEALYALLLAHHLTGEEKYLTWYEKVHDWSFNHFSDAEYGEWFGYLHRDGSLSIPIKGSMWKGAFHLPRALLLCLKLLEEGQALGSSRD